MLKKPPAYKEHEYLRHSSAGNEEEEEVKTILPYPPNYSIYWPTEPNRSASQQVTLVVVVLAPSLPKVI